MEEKKEKTDANDLVSPRNVKRLYGKRAAPKEPRPGSVETTETDLPEDFSGVDQEVGENVYPSHSDHHPNELEDV